MKTMKTYRTRRAFTMIELLVVIAIIAILAAILFPVFAIVREQARQSSTMSNMQAVYVGAKLYNEDEGHYPSVLFGYAESSTTAMPPHSLLTAAGKGAGISPMSGITGSFAKDKSVGGGILAGYLYHEQIKDYVTFLAGDDAITDQTDTTEVYYPPHSIPGGEQVGPAISGTLNMVKWGLSVPGGACPYYGDSDLPSTAAVYDGKPKIFYKMDAMDISPMVDGNGKVVRVSTDGSGNVVSSGGQIAYELHYAPDWTGDLWNAANKCDVDINGNPLVAQLKYKNPPSDRTVLTYITSHVAFGNSAKVMVLLLSGTVKKMEAKDAFQRLPLAY